MNKRVKNILLNMFLILVIIFILLLFHVGFIAGPNRAHEHEDHLYVEAFETQHNLENVTLLNRFSLDDTYYIVRLGRDMYWFNQALNQFDKTDYIALDSVYETASLLGFDQDEVMYGIYDKQIVFALESELQFVYLNIETLEVVFEFGGR